MNGSKLALRIDTMLESKAWQGQGLDRLATKAVRATLTHLRLGPAWEVSVLGCDDARIAALNADFRGKGQPTNVLSWPSADRAARIEGQTPPSPDPAWPELGDIAIAWGTCRAEAEAAGLPLRDHVTHLLVHATLHLLGYDHERDGDAALMERLEAEILATLGLKDPYRDHGPVGPV
ncbi:hypothetical protein OCGS_0460 [Oceaniovalibus guishaninsula JLT2003]|uniref:Endoribonuclease YbeY n=1 Tax=Oceaniovalibus guishaninsula JLT2003 TaxID=1231392 RepID=K2I8J5_9RHOB|nr:rRNA maturation RNase YbeY [Oceaniovalibus guishaninsula]EKE45370.1 hypothetical protein OCGS_0460 [Oceaniovalibus guishaninsula JLT2003]